MNIVWITRSDLFDRTNGADIYSHGLLTGLESCDVTGQVFGYTGRETEVVAHGPMAQRLFPRPQRSRVLSLFTTQQSDAHRIHSLELAKAAIAAIDANTDAVVVDYFSTGWILPSLRRSLAALGKRPPTLVYVAHNHESTLRPRVAQQYAGNAVMKAALKLDASKARRLEQKLVEASDLVTAITDEDAELFRRDAPGKRVVTLLPAYNGPVDADWQITPATAKRVVMMGSLEWIAKQENLKRFAEAANEPFSAAGIELAIIGKVDSAFAQSVRSRSPVCNFLGFVDDPESIIRDARVGLMADEMGGGFKLKYLDYIFRGLPVATIRSQAVGLPLALDDCMFLGSSAGDLAARIVDNIDDFDRLNEMKWRAYAGCRGKFDWPSRGAILRNAIDDTRLAMR